MEGLKSAPTVISTVSVVGLFCASGYFYKKIEGLETQINEFSDVLTKVVDRMEEKQNVKDQLDSMAGAIRGFASTIKDLEELVSAIDSSVRENERKLKIITEALADEGISVNFNKKKKRKGKTTKKKDSSSESESDSDSDDYLQQIKRKN